jgi:hypothetical protein
MTMPESLLNKICKIVSDGTPTGTLVYGPDGVPLPYVEKLELTLDCDRAFAEVKLTVLASVEIEAKVTEVILDKKDIIK